MSLLTNNHLQNLCQSHSHKISAPVDHVSVQERTHMCMGAKQRQRHRERERERKKETERDRETVRESACVRMYIRLCVTVFVCLSNSVYECV